MLSPDALRLVDEAFEAFAAPPAGPPGIAWGVVAGGALVHVGASGTLRVGEDRPPDAASIFRIASMTKSFTAAVLLLRDEGRLALDDLIARHVPEVADLSGPTRDSPPVTIRHLLTMSGGLPTDDPLGDRLQGLPLEAFADMLQAGVTFALASRHDLSSTPTSGTGSSGGSSRTWPVASTATWSRSGCSGRSGWPTRRTFRTRSPTLG